jgi:hypothetical protein
VPKGEGWFVLNAHEARWFHIPGRPAICQFAGAFEGEQDFLQLGINVSGPRFTKREPTAYRDGLASRLGGAGYWRRVELRRLGTLWQ